MTGWIVAGAIGFPLFLIALHFIKKSTALQVQNESLVKAANVKDRQIDIAARPPVSGAVILDELSDGNL